MLVERHLKIYVSRRLAFQMSVLNEGLIEVFKYVEHTVEVDAVEFKCADNIDSFVILGVDNARERQIPTHCLQRKIPRHGHLILDQQVAMDCLTVESFVSQ